MTCMHTLYTSIHEVEASIFNDLHIWSVSITICKSNCLSITISSNSIVEAATASAVVAVVVVVVVVSAAATVVVVVRNGGGVGTRWPSRRCTLSAEVSDYIRALREPVIYMNTPQKRTQ